MKTLVVVVWQHIRLCKQRLSKYTLFSNNFTTKYLHVYYPASGRMNHPRDEQCQICRWRM